MKVRALRETPEWCSTEAERPMSECVVTVRCMPTCAKCEASFPNRKYIDGKWRILNKRRYCLDCSPFGQHNTQPLHRQTPDAARKLGDKLVCTCGRIYIYETRKGHTKQRCNSCAVNGRRTELKKAAVAYKGGKCSRCAYSRCLDAMQFHHRDPGAKDFQLAGSLYLKWSRVKQELDKCDLVCVRCHVEIHHEIHELRCEQRRASLAEHDAVAQGSAIAL